MADIKWEAPEWEHRPKTVSWYWASIIISILILALAIWQKNFFFAVFVLIAEILVMVWGSVEPPMIKFELNEKGLRVGKNRFFPMRQLRAFSADLEGFSDPNHPDIVLHFNGHFRPALRIKVPRAWMQEIRKEFRAHIPELHFTPSFVEVIEKVLGF